MTDAPRCNARQDDSPSGKLKTMHFSKSLTLNAQVQIPLAHFHHGDIIESDH